MSEQTQHLSDLAIDRWLVGELDEAGIDLAEQHIEACARCHARYREVQADREAFLAVPPPLKRPVRRAPPRWRTYWVSAGALTAAVAALLVWLSLRGSEPDGESDRTRLKGAGFSIGFYVLRDGNVFEPRADEPLRPGDAVRFALGAARDTHVLILGKDSAGVVSVYYSDGPYAARVEASGDEIRLPESVTLDDVLGPEDVVALFCELAVLAEPIAASWRTGELEIPERCSARSLRWTKVGGPPR
jgi:hypothetical protein